MKFNDINRLSGLNKLSKGSDRKFRQQELVRLRRIVCFTVSHLAVSVPNHFVFEPDIKENNPRTTQYIQD